MSRSRFWAWTGHYMLSRPVAMQVARRKQSQRATRAAIGFETLEPRLVLHGDGLEVLPLPELLELEQPPAPATTIEAAGYPLADTFQLNSRPTANHTIHLDFDGHVTANTSWNYAGPFTSPAFDTDGDPSTFSDAELAAIQVMFDRVAEDYVPFDVNVTTQEPAAGDLIYSGVGDTRWGQRIVIGGTYSDWYGGAAGGVAFLNSFNWSDGSPAYVFSTSLNNNLKYVAEAASHEAGHTVGLRHHGTSTSTYYAGHGSGETSWAPIIGVGYYTNLTQWSHGEYPDANNSTQDDLAIITTQNGFGYRPDDHGSTITLPAGLELSGSTVTASGIIERNTDADVFAFYTEAGSVSFNIDPAPIGPNLDILADILDATGSVIASSNPVDFLAASFTDLVLATGQYFLRVDGTGKGDPLAGGYSAYGSLGQYTISGAIYPAAVNFSIGDVTVNESSGVAVFTVSLSEASASTLTVDVATVNDSALAGSDYTAINTTLTFLPGELAHDVVVSINDDTLVELTERFGVRLSNPTGGAGLADIFAAGTIVDNDAPLIAINDTSVTEGNLAKGKNAGPQIVNMVFTVTLSKPSPTTVTVNFSTADGTAIQGQDYLATSGQVTFAPGQTVKNVTIYTLGDTLIEGNETLLVNLSNPVNAVLDKAVGLVLCHA